MWQLKQEKEKDAEILLVIKAKICKITIWFVNAEDFDFASEPIKLFAPF